MAELCPNNMIVYGLDRATLAYPPSLLLPSANAAKPVGTSQPVPIVSHFLCEDLSYYLSSWLCNVFISFLDVFVSSDRSSLRYDMPI